MMKRMKFGNPIQKQNLREGVKKKKNKKHGFLHVLYFDPPAPPKHGLFFFFWSEPPPNYPTPSQMGKNFFAFLDVSEHLEAIKKNKNKHGF